MKYTSKPPRTDMAVEFVKNTKASRGKDGVKKTEVKVDENLSARLGRPVGRYVTLECDAALKAERFRYKPLINAIADTLSSMCEGCLSYLAVGVGNPLLTADALGAKAVSLLKVNRGFARIGESELAAFSPGVSGVTGIESVDFVKSVTRLVKPDCVIVIDSLASAAVSRIGTAFQITDSGLTPGSGVDDKKQPLNAASLNVKRTVSVGVPLVVYAETIIRDALGDDTARSADEDISSLVVTPKDIDLIMGECAHIIAEGINTALKL